MTPPIVLASRSPRRQQLLAMLGIPTLVMPADVQEIPLPREAPEAYARRLARDKARAVPGELVLGADTIVVVDGEVLEKPADPDHAVTMLERLAGREHQVITAICLIAGGVEFQASDTTRVWFRPLDRETLAAYVATGEALDKAGAYGIQGYGAALVERIEGDFFSVMGLPVRLVIELLERSGHSYRFPPSVRGDGDAPVSG